MTEDVRAAVRELLFIAFLAGFETSGEGFNGEWARDSGNVLKAELRERFDLLFMI